MQATTTAVGSENELREDDVRRRESPTSPCPALREQDEFPIVQRIALTTTGAGLSRVCELAPKQLLSAEDIKAFVYEMQQLLNRHAPTNEIRRNPLQYLTNYIVQFMNDDQLTLWSPFLGQPA